MEASSEGFMSWLSKIIPERPTQAMERGSGVSLIQKATDQG